eukprot:765923-Hanusia_phi.AAC.4
MRALDALYLPTPAGVSEALCASVVKMMGSPCNEVPGSWLLALHTVGASSVDAKHGTNRYDLVCAQAGKLAIKSEATMLQLKDELVAELTRRRWRRCTAGWTTPSPAGGPRYSA